MTSRRPAAALLLKALTTIKFRRHELNTFSDANWLRHLGRVSEDWSRSHHEELARFIRAGDHEALATGEDALVISEEAERAKAIIKKAADKLTGLRATAVYMDELAALDALEQEVALEGKEPRSQSSQEGELDEMILL